MNIDDIISIENKHDSRQFNKKIPIIHGEGATLHDQDGNEYIDCMGGHGVSVLGYSHPKVTASICEYLQAKRPITCGHFYDPDRAKLIQRLINLTPKNLTRVFFSNSGTESVEAALKFAMKYKKNIKRKEIIAFKKGFHGRTLGALSTTFEPRYRKDYNLIDGVTHVSYNDIDSVKEAVNENTIAIILELIQGEGGVHPASESFPRELRELCDEKDILLIFDEVQTGFGRTGKLFALEHWNVSPDILCLAKGIAAGIPMGATITTDKVMNAVNPGAHGSTFGGNPFACHVAMTSLDIIHDEGLLENARRVSEYLFKELQSLVERYRVIKEVRGKGLMIGIQFSMKVKGIMQELLKRRILTLNAGLTVVRLLPPLVITMDQAKRVIESLEDVLSRK
ncbi:MAG: aspartate aminotransferase family protein [Promethearchaeota archaeon]